MFWKKPELNDENTFKSEPELIEPSGPTASGMDVWAAETNNFIRNYAGFGVSDDLNRSEVYRRKNERVREVTGEELFNPQTSVYGMYHPWMDDDAKARASTDYETYKADGGELTWGGYIRDRWSEEEWRRRAEKAIAKHPELRDEILAPATIGEQGMQLGRDASQRAADVWEQSDKGLGAWSGYLAGGFQGQLVDPAFYMSAPLGFGGVQTGAKGLLMGAAKAAGINMASQAVVEPSIADYQTRMGNQYGLPEMATSIGMAGAFGAVVDAGFRGTFRGARWVQGMEPVTRDGIVVGYRKPQPDAAPLPELPPVSPELQERLKAGDEAAQADVLRELGIEDGIPDAIVQRADDGDMTAVSQLLAREAEADPVLRQTLEAAQADDMLAARPRADIPDGEHAATMMQALRAVADPDHEPLPVRVDTTAIPEGNAATLRAEINRLQKDIASAGDNRAEIEARLGDLEAQVRMIDTFGRDPVGDAVRLRDNPELLTRDFDLDAPAVQQVRKLASLTDEAFGMVQEGKIKPSVAALVADFVPEHLQVRALGDLAKRKVVSPEDGRATIAELLRSPDYVKPVKAEAGPVSKAAASPELLDDPYGAQAKQQVQALEQQMREELKAIGKAAPQAIDAIATPEGRIATVARAQMIEQALADLLPIAPQGTQLRIFDRVDDMPPSLAAQVRAGNAVKFNRALDRFQRATTEPERLAAARVMQSAKRLQGIEGVADGDAIWISAAAMNPRATFAHETVHALRRAGVLAPEEVKLLAQAARDAGTFSANTEGLYRQSYESAFPSREALDDVIDEEAAAHYIEAALNDRLPAAAAADVRSMGIIDRIRDLFDRIREMLTGQGYRAKAEDTPVDPARDVVDAILAGDVARREVKAEWMRNNPQAVTLLKEAAKVRKQAVKQFMDDKGYTSMALVPDRGAGGEAPTYGRVTTPDGSATYPIRYDVVDLATLQKATGDLQPRDRATRAASDAQIENIAANLNGDLLLYAPQSDRGAPIVDENGVVLSGNARVAALTLAKRKHPEKYQAYLDVLKREGFKVDGMDAPVMVRRLETLEDTDKRKFAVASNKDDKLAMSPSEQAKVDRDLMTDDVLKRLDPEGEAGLGSASNRDFVRAVMAKISPAERAAFQSEDGALTPQGVARLEAGIFARAYEDPALVTKIVEDADAPGIRNALIGAAPAWAQMKTLSPEFDVTPNLVEAVNILNRIRETKVKVDDYFAQQDAFSRVSPETETIVRMFYKEDGRRASWRATRDGLKEYARVASDQGNAVGDLLGTKPAPLQILQGELGKMRSDFEIGPGLFAFAGEKARTANTTTLSMAKSMEKGGLDRTRIWRMTGWFKGVDQKWRFETNDEMATLGDMRRGNLVDVLDNPEALAAYPDMQGMIADFRRVAGMESGTGRYDSGPVEKMTVQAPDFDEMLSIGLHEMQHGIQAREGFAYGGEASQFSPQEVLAERDYLMSVVDKVPEDTWTMVGNLPGDMPDQQIRQMLYARLAGEVEARTVQKRAKMTAAERAARAPWDDYDIPERMQILTFLDEKQARSEFRTDAAKAREEGAVMPDGSTVKGIPLFKFEQSGEGKTAYHGTPWRFDRFSMDAIGKGEGAQVYGMGLYFAGNRKVAEWYKDTLTKRHLGSVPLTGVEKIVAVDGKRLSSSMFKTPYMRHADTIRELSNAGSFEAFEKALRKAIRTTEKFDQRTAKEMRDGLDELEDLANDERLSWRDPVKGEALLVGGKPLPREQKTFADRVMQFFGKDAFDASVNPTTSERWNMLASVLDSEAKLLRDQYKKQVGSPLQRLVRGKVFRDTFSKAEYQGLLNEADGIDVWAQKAREHAKANTPVDLPDRPEGALYQVYLKVDDEDLVDWDLPITQQSPTVQPVLEDIARKSGLDPNVATVGDVFNHRTNADALETKLAAAGIRGIKYLDGMSRGKGQGDHNYVIFDEDAIQIHAVNDQPIGPVKDSALFSFGEDEPFDAKFIAKKSNGAGVYVSSRGPGYGYTDAGVPMLVEVDPRRVMRWDNWRQSDEVRRAVNAVAFDVGVNVDGFNRGEKIYKALAKKLGSDEAATDALREVGVHGHTLTDEVDGYQNTVVYDPTLIKPDPRSDMASRETVAVQQALKLTQTAADWLRQQMGLPTRAPSATAAELSERAAREAPYFGLPDPPKTLADDDPLLVSRDTDMSPERLAMREALVADRFRGKQPAQGQKIAVLMGGGGAAGKGTALKALRKRGLVDDGYVELDPDSFKTGDKKHGWGGIPEYWDMVERGDSRAAGVTHEESSLVFKQAMRRAIEGGYSMVLDRTMGTPSKALAEMQMLKDAGYEIRLVGVTADPALAIRRAVERAKGEEKRYVPLNDLLAAHKGFSQGFESYAKVADRVYLYDSNRSNMRQIARKNPGDVLDVLDNEAYVRFAQKGALNEKADTYAQLDAEGAGQVRSMDGSGGLLGGRDQGSAGGPQQGAGGPAPRAQDNRALAGERLEQPPALFAMRNEDGRMKRGADRRAKALKADLDQIEADLAAAAINEREALQRKRATFLNAKAEEVGLDDAMGYRSPRGQEDVAIAFLRMHESLGIHGAPFMDVRTQRDLIAKEAVGMMDEVMWQLRKGAISGDLRRVKNQAVRTRMENMIREAAGEKTGDATAQRMGQAWQQAAEYLRQRFNAAGGDIAKLAGWFAPQYHDPERVLRAGRQAWTDYMMGDGVLDRDRMRNFDGSRMSDGELRNMLRDIWETISTDGANKQQIGDSFGKGALYKRHAEHRVLHFKNADAYLSYAKEYGGGDPYSMMLGHISMMARDIAALERFGANPEVVRERIKQQIIVDAKTARSARSVYDDLADLVSDLKTQVRGIATPVDKAMKQISDVHARLDEIRGNPRKDAERARLQTELVAANQGLETALQPAAADPQSTALVQRILAVTEEMDEIARTQSVLTRNPEERARRILTRADEMWKLYMGHTNVPIDGNIAGFLSGLRNWISSSMLVMAPMSSITDQATSAAARAFIGMPVAKQLSSFVKAWTPADRQFALRAGIGLDQAMHAFAVSQRFMGFVNTSQVTGFIADRTHALSLLAPMTQASKVAFASDFMAWMADTSRTKAWSALDPWMRQMMDRHGFTQADYTAMQGAVPDVHRGVPMMTRGALERAAGRDTAERFMRMMLREQAMAVLEPTLQGRTAIVSETKPGTVIGEMARSAAMLKSFPTSYMMLILGRFYNQALAGRAMSGNTVAAGAAILGAGVLLGALAMQMKSLGKGQDPQPMDNKEFWIKAFFQSGGLGIYGDFVNNAINRQGGSLAQTIAGPMAAEGQLLLNLTLGNLVQYAQGEETNAGREFTNYARQRTPGAFVPWYVRTAYDRMVLDELQKMVDPEAHKAFRRKVKNQKKLGGNDFYWRPGEFAPRGAPNMGAAFGAQ